MFNGGERLILNGKKTDYTMLQFWQITLSDILLNMTRGSFAEFIVRCALDSGGFKCLDKSRTGIEPWDIQCLDEVTDFYSQS